MTRTPDETAAMTNLGIEPVCFDCPHLRTIDPGKLYRCMQYAFQRTRDGECEEKTFVRLTGDQAVAWHEATNMTPRVIDS